MKFYYWFKWKGRKNLLGSMFKYLKYLMLFSNKSYTTSAHKIKFEYNEWSKYREKFQTTNFEIKYKKKLNEIKLPLKCVDWLTNATKHYHITKNQKIKW